MKRIRGWWMLALLLLCSCSFLKQQHAEEHATGSLSEEARAIEEAQARSSETYEQEPTIITTTTEVFQPVVGARELPRPTGQEPLLGPRPIASGLSGSLAHVVPSSGTLIKRTVRVEERGKVTDQKNSESSGKASESLSLDAGVATEGHADKESDTKPAPSCAFTGSLWAIAAIGIVLLAAAAYRRATRQ